MLTKEVSPKSWSQHVIAVTPHAESIFLRKIDRSGAKKLRRKIPSAWQI
jgi:hypothetical protein